DVAAGAAAEQAAGRALRQPHHAGDPSRICGNMVQLGCNRAHYLWLRAQKAPEGAKTEDMSGQLHRLSNGIAVAVDPLPGAESAVIGLYAMVGSRSEPEHLSGLAHLGEHMGCKRAGPRDPRG